MYYVDNSVLEAMTAQAGPAGLIPMAHHRPPAEEMCIRCPDGVNGRYAGIAEIVPLEPVAVPAAVELVEDFEPSLEAI